MMKSKELRAKAWASLKGKYWNAFAVTLVAGLLTGISGTVSASDALLASVLGVLIFLFVDGPIYIGESRFYIMNTQGKPDFKELFFGFDKEHFLNIVKIHVVMSVKIMLWSLLMVIPGIVKAYEYAMIPYLLAEDPGMSMEDAFARSKEMMTGNKFRLFKLHLSFIGWVFLSFFTFGLGLFFLAPYFAAACAEFYAELKG